FNAGPARITVAPNTSGLSPQVYSASLKITFPDESVRTIPVSVILSPAAPGSSAKAAISASGCAPSALSVTPTSLPSGFSTPVSSRGGIEPKVVEICGQRGGKGSFAATFSPGAPPLSLIPLQNGTWTATWQPRNSASLTIRVNATGRPSSLRGSASISGKL